MKQILPFLILGAVLISACKKEKQQAQQNLCDAPTINNSNCTMDSNQLRAQVIGRWDWTRSISSWVTVETTPCTDSIYRSYDFLSDGTIQYFENGEFVKQGTYYFAGNSLIAGDTAATFGLRGYTSICDNYLIVDNSPVDGPKTILVRPGE